MVFPIRKDDLKGDLLGDLKSDLKGDFKGAPVHFLQLHRVMLSIYKCSVPNGVELNWFLLICNKVLRSIAIQLSVA